MVEIKDSIGGLNRRMHKTGVKSEVDYQAKDLYLSVRRKGHPLQPPRLVSRKLD